MLTCCWRSFGFFETDGDRVSVVCTVLEIKCHIFCKYPAYFINQPSYTSRKKINRLNKQTTFIHHSLFSSRARPFLFRYLSASKEGGRCFDFIQFMYCIIIMFMFSICCDIVECINRLLRAKICLVLD